MQASLTLTVSASQGSSFIRSLSHELRAELIPEMELTLKVAVLSAAGYSRTQVVARLGVEDVEVRMALARLKRVSVRL